MASSGVWENIILSKTPTFDVVCGMLIFTILIYVGIILLFNLPYFYISGSLGLAVLVGALGPESVSLSTIITAVTAWTTAWLTIA